MDLNKLTTKNKAYDILKLIHGLTSAAIRYGFYLKHWKRVVYIMIYEKPGNIKLESLQIIKLFEPDFNLMIRILFDRRAMQY